MTDWAPLDVELDRWRADALTLPIWWRDDDAVAPTPELDRLANISAKHEINVHLAIIPARAEPALAEMLRPGGPLIPVVHGWAHENHAPPGQKKCEFPAARALPEQVRDIARARARLTEVLGVAPLPLFVPPWNRMDQRLAPALAQVGYRGLSMFGPRPSGRVSPGLTQINTHVDPVNWRGGGGLVDPKIQIARLAAYLADRRRGAADATEPLGLLTHHLVHDAATWDFVDGLLSVLRDGPVSVHPGPVIETTWGNARI